MRVSVAGGEQIRNRVNASTWGHLPSEDTTGSSLVDRRLGVDGGAGPTST